MGIVDLFSVCGWHTRRGVPGVHPDPRLLGLRRIFYRRKGINRYYSYVLYTLHIFMGLPLNVYVLFLYWKRCHLIWRNLLLPHCVIKEGRVPSFLTAKHVPPKDQISARQTLSIFCVKRGSDLPTKLPLLPSIPLALLIGLNAGQRGAGMAENYSPNDNSFLMTRKNGLVPSSRPKQSFFL